MPVIARRGGQFLRTTATEDEVQIVDLLADDISPPLRLQTVLAQGYWEDSSDAEFSRLEPEYAEYRAARRRGEAVPYPAA